MTQKISRILDFQISSFISPNLINLTYKILHDSSSGTIKLRDRLVHSIPIHQLSLLSKSFTQRYFSY
ncbi:hypothetical protein DASC09_001820 [Saccharomycopsis crataegensis]|uniref:Uncharacterized protein n=1 Tax=Saccharomycopsis crataegensis TaxID=43959 RepID=A0AAV5QDV0_9ASCO|nr:hypothetical protein DASC09_001820 [Saccharomycopsis crataegensis]